MSGKPAAPLVRGIVRAQAAVAGTVFAGTVLAGMLVAGCIGGGAASPTGSTGSDPESGSTGSTRLPEGSDRVELHPADFGGPIDNPYWPMTPGAKWVYREVDADGVELTVDVTVTGETRRIMGIEATVVHDVVTEGGTIIEDTYDWYAQDTGGNVWYLGEATEEYEGGRVVSTEGSWEAGVDGAQPGIIVPAVPRVGMAYRQEYKTGEAEDAARILSLDERVEVPFGSFDEVLMTRDDTPLQPEVLEHKFYAKGVGPVLVVGVSGGAGREELIRFEPGRGSAATSPT